MITRMKIEYRSKLPCSVKPEIFTTGGYTVNVGGHELLFDFQDMTASTEIEDGYLYIHALQKNFDEELIDEMTLAEADEILRRVKKEEFTEIFYECFANADETDFILLEPLSITFYDYSITGDGAPIVVDGESFSGIETEN